MATPLPIKGKGCDKCGAEIAHFDLLKPTCGWRYLCQPCHEFWATVLISIRDACAALPSIGYVLRVYDYAQKLRAEAREGKRGPDGEIIDAPAEEGDR